MPKRHQKKVRMESSAVNPVERMKEILNGTEEPDRIEELLRREIRNRTARSCLKWILVLLAAGSVITSDSCWQHIRAVGRIGLIELTPVWDWSDYYYSECLLSSTQRPDDVYQKQPISSLRNPQCSFCEDLEAVDIVNNVSARFVMDQYVSLNLPVVVKDEMQDWPATNLENIIQAYRQDDSGWGICQWMSSTRLYHNLDDFFQLVERFPPEKSWFAHWENCARRSVKTGRRFYRRPPFITAAVDLSLNNWILLSGNYYRARRFKPIMKMRSGLAIWVQLNGSNVVHLRPGSDCSDHCSVIQLTLVEGEIGLFNPNLWSIEYLPEENKFNMAVIIQGDAD